MRGLRKARVHFERAVELGLSGFPVPIVNLMNPSERQMCLRTTVIDRDRSFCSRARCTKVQRGGNVAHNGPQRLGL